MLPTIIVERQPQIDELCRRYHVRRLELFGSAATGDWDPASSDLDFLVEFEPEQGFTTHADLKDALCNLFAREVDLIFDVEFRNPYFRQSVADSRTHLWGEQRQAAPGNGVRVSSHRALKYLWEIRQEAGYLAELAAHESLEETMESQHLVRSVPQALTRIGESINNLSKEYGATANRITDYQGYIGQRNILVHRYTDIDWDKVWRTVTVEVPVLIEEVDALIAELDPPAEAK